MKQSFSRKPIFIFYAGALWYAEFGATCVGLHFSKLPLNLSILGQKVILNICFEDQTKLKIISEMKPTLNVSTK
jgi:hypothetical protein